MFELALAASFHSLIEIIACNILEKMGCTATKEDKTVFDHTGSHSTDRKKTIRERVTLVTSPQKRAEALDEDSKKVAIKKQKWLNKQVSQLDANKGGDWERVFDSMCQELNKTELSITELDQLFKKLGTKVNKPMLHLMFSLFDANNNGKVDKTEFLVTMTFLAEAHGTDDIIDLAFFIFDTNKSGAVSKTEFSTMCYALMNKAKFVLGIPVFRKIFRQHLEAEHCAESLDFYEEYQKARKVITPAKFVNDSRRFSLLEFIPEEAVLTIQDARDIYAKYIYEGAPNQVNLSAANRNRVEDVIKENKERTPSAIVDAGAFDACVNELINLIETDSMGRFKEKLRHDKLWISQQVWDSEKIKGDVMTKAQFRKWAQKNPQMFSFLEELRFTLKKALHRQKLAAILSIQRAYRRRIRENFKQLVVDAMQHKDELK